jgi:hypothetical protein
MLIFTMKFLLAVFTLRLEGRRLLRTGLCSIRSVGMPLEYSPSVLEEVKFLSMLWNNDIVGTKHNLFVLSRSSLERLEKVDKSMR